MQMFEEDDKIVFELTPEETDRLFEPFNGGNRTLSFSDYRNRFRFFRPDVEAWFERMMANPPAHDLLDVDTGAREISFKEKRHAMAFKLAYAA